MPLRCESAAKRGLTLLEFLFAISILAIAILGVAGMFPAAFRSVVQGGNLTKATVLARSMVETLRAEPFATLDAYNAFDTRDPLSGYRCPVTVASTHPSFNRMSMKCDVSGDGALETGQGLPHGYAMVMVACVDASGLTGACASTDLRQVTVTVFWEPQAARSVQLVTYRAR